MTEDPNLDFTSWWFKSIDYDNPAEKIDQLCKYSPLKEPKIVKELFSPQESDYCSNYLYATDTQFLSSMINRRLCKDLSNKFSGRTEERLMKHARQEITEYYLKDIYHKHQNINSIMNFLFSKEDSIDGTNIVSEADFSYWKYYFREGTPGTVNHYFNVVSDRFLLCFLEDDRNYKNPKMGRGKEVLFSTNSLEIDVARIQRKCYAIQCK